MLAAANLVLLLATAGSTSLAATKLCADSIHSSKVIRVPFLIFFWHDDEVEIANKTTQCSRAAQLFTLFPFNS